MKPARALLVAIALAVTLLVTGLVARPGAAASAPKSGGNLNIILREDLPQGFAIHETSTISTVWLAAPCFSNLVIFDPLKKTESPDAIVGELAEKWSWQDGSRSLVFFLRRDVKWHDGRSFTAKDPAKRVALVQGIQKKLEEDAARPVLFWGLDYFTLWPHVKNLVPHQVIYNWARMQDVWSDK